jgi:fucose permease
MAYSSGHREKYTVGAVFYTFALQGAYVTVIGTVLPMLRAEYGLSYDMGGLMISVHFAGYIANSLAASYIAMLIGMKKAFVLQNAIAFLGLILITFTGDPKWLLAAMLLMGIARGAHGNYVSQIINDMTQSSPSAMNLLCVFFAAGAFSAPFVTLFFTRNGDEGWKGAIIAITAAGLVGVALTFFMRLNDLRQRIESKTRLSLLFFKEKHYWISIGVMFSYLGVEASIMGWIVSYFADSGVVNEQSSQMLASLIWFSLMVGRLVCSAAADRLPIKKLIFGLSMAVAFFCVLLLRSDNMVLLPAAAGLGLAMSGLYPTVVADVGHILTRYPLALGFYITIAGVGSMVIPALIGFAAERNGIHDGMRLMAVSVGMLVATAAWNMFSARSGKRMGQ